MIEIDDKIVSTDLLRECFACDLGPVKASAAWKATRGHRSKRTKSIRSKRNIPTISSYMTPEGIRAVEAQGFMVVDEDGDYTTPLVDDAECAYASYGRGDHLLRHRKGVPGGKTTFRKPISCHLYPIRLMNFSNGTVDSTTTAGRSANRHANAETARDPGVQGASGADHPSLRRRVLQSARNCGTTAQESIRNNDTK